MSRKASGLSAWLVQRISAVYVAVFWLYLLGHLTFNPPGSYQDWHQWVSEPVRSALFALFFMSILLHAWVGIRDVLIDYVHVFALRLSMLACLALFLLFTGFWLLRSLILAIL